MKAEPFLTTLMDTSHQSNFILGENCKA